MDVFIEGALKTLEISALALLIGIPIGIIFGMGRISKNKIIRLLSSIYVEVMRGVPLLVLLIWIFFVLGQFLKLGAYWGAIIGLAIFTGAFIAEIVRSGIQGVPKGQMEAARSSGMSYTQAMRIYNITASISSCITPISVAVYYTNKRFIFSISNFSDGFNIERKKPRCHIVSFTGSVDICCLNLFHYDIQLIADYPVFRKTIVITRGVSIS